MCESCPFLEKKFDGYDLLCCAAGVNFYAVGQTRDLCQLCPLYDGGWKPACEFMEVYTFLQVERGQQWIEVRLDCWPLEDEVAECFWHREMTRSDV